MVQRTGGFRRKSRHKLTKGLRAKGKVSLSRYFQKLEIGDKVCLKAEPSIHKGMYLPRFHSKIGILKAKKGTCYEVLIKDQNKQKTLIVHPVHIKKV